MLIIDENLLEIDDLIDKILVEFAKFPEVRAYRQAKSNFLDDKKLQEKIARLNENADFITFRPELKILQKEVNVDDKVYALRLAENDIQTILSVLTKKITSSISEKIIVDENLPLKGGGHRGRHHGTV